MTKFEDQFSERRRLAPKRRYFLLSLLVALSIPSFFLAHPLPVDLSDTITPLSVGCVLPSPSESGTGLEDFLKETRRLAGSAKILLWPEGAIDIRTRHDKEVAISAIREIANQEKLWIGFSFVEPAPAAHGRSDLRQNGLTLVGPGSDVFTYYKRHLVPVAETFSQIPSSEQPPLVEIELLRPSHSPKSKWGDHRSVTLTAGICLDFSTPFPRLDRRPALILAPARTWHQDVAYGMWSMAQSRAEELGSHILWCDGGDVGFSGVTSARGDEIVQVGPGSWVKTIGIPHELDSRRTVYAEFGDWGAVLLVWLILLLDYPINRVLVTSFRPHAAIASVGARLLQARERVAAAVPWRTQPEPVQANLIDI